jgi:hypothetical protein
MEKIKALRDIKRIFNRNIIPYANSIPTFLSTYLDATFAPQFNQSSQDAIGINVQNMKLSLSPSAYTSHRKLISWSSYLQTHSTQLETSMNLASFFYLVLLSLVIMTTFLACFIHSSKTSPLFLTPRMHRLPNLTPPPLPAVNTAGTFLAWVRVCFYVSDEVRTHKEERRGVITHTIRMRTQLILPSLPRSWLRSSHRKSFRGWATMR